MAKALVTITLRVSQELADKLEHISKHTGESKNAVVNRLLEEVKEGK